MELQQLLHFTVIALGKRQEGIGKGANRVFPIPYSLFPIP